MSLSKVPSASFLCNIARGTSKVIHALLPTFVLSESTAEDGPGIRRKSPGSTSPSGSRSDVYASQLPSELVDELARSTATRGAEIRYRAVPATRTARAASFTSLFMQIGWDKLTGGNQGDGMLSTNSHMRIVDTLCRMRGAVLKLGQMLSIQDSSTVPSHVTSLFERVRDQAFAMPKAQLDATLAREFKDPQWESKLFERFHPAPIAAASIGEVHQAILKAEPAGEPFPVEVAVKVQYPGVAQSVDSDVANLSMLLSLNILPPGMFVDRILNELRQELRLECQYTVEGTKQSRYRDLVQADPLLSDLFYVPKVYERVSTDNVLVSEFIRGIPVDQLAIQPGVPQPFRNYIASKMMRLTLTELFCWRFMQTDPNYANYLYDATANRVNLLDFGAAREYDVSFVKDYLDVVAAAAREERDVIVEKSIALGFLTGREVKEMIDAHVASVLLLGKPFRNRTRPFDFSAENLPERIHSYVPTMVRLRLRPPPTPIYSLHRSLSGVILLATKLQASMDSGAMFWNIHDAFKRESRQADELPSGHPSSI